MGRPRVRDEFDNNDDFVEWYEQDFPRLSREQLALYDDIELEDMRRRYRQHQIETGVIVITIVEHDDPAYYSRRIDYNDPHYSY